MRSIFSLLILLFCGYTLWAQYPPQAPEPGNDAITKDDYRITGWATGCTVQRGWKDIADTSLGKVTSGNENSVLGSPDLDVLSLGDGGVATVTFASPITDGSGPDFAVFENGFTDPTNGYEAYLEFAFVAVSSDGVHFVTFPATSLTQDTVQVNNDTYMDARLVNNLAGKYANGYGTPFDLSELADSPNIDLQNIRYVRITDVVGSINPQYARYDQNGHIINDPFPTPYPTGGFDLNAIAVLKENPSGITTTESENDFKIWPVPCGDFVFVQPKRNKGFIRYELFSLDGRKVCARSGVGKIEISLKDLAAGTYFLKCSSPKGFIQTLVLNKE